MMIRSVLAVVTLALAVGSAAAQDPIAARRAVMKANGEQAALGAKMVKGEEPFDLAKAQKIFATYQDAAGKVPSLFPDNSKTGGETAALPVIWEKKDDFNARITKLGADAKVAAEKVKDFDSFKVEFPLVQKNCGGCHENYRVKKS
jgi:cytochrome c556